MSEYENKFFPQDGKESKLDVEETHALGHETISIWETEEERIIKIVQRAIDDGRIKLEVRR